VINVWTSYCIQYIPVLAQAIMQEISLAKACARKFGGMACAEHGYLELTTFLFIGQAHLETKVQACETKGKRTNLTTVDNLSAAASVWAGTVR